MFIAISIYTYTCALFLQLTSNIETTLVNSIDITNKVSIINRNLTQIIELLKHINQLGKYILLLNKKYQHWRTLQMRCQSIQM